MTTENKITFIIPPDLKKLRLCACMGPRNDEPYCPCTMINRGLKTEDDYKLSDEEIAEFAKGMESFFEQNKKAIYGSP